VVIVAALNRYTSTLGSRAIVSANIVNIQLAVTEFRARTHRECDFRDFWAK
jgi:hypothetical protein